MSRSLDKLLDLLKSDSKWATLSPVTVRRSVKLIPLMSILPDGPQLKVEYKDAVTNEVVIDMVMTLEQVDCQIGELIKMRDMMAVIKGEQ